MKDKEKTKEQLVRELSELRRRVIGLEKSESEHKRAQEESVQLATAIQQAAESIVITDKQGTIQYVNPGFEVITGYTRQQAIGQNPRILKSGKQDGAFYRAMWNTLTSGQVWSGHFINKKKDGTLYEEEATISPIRDGSGRIVNYVAVKRDVTEEMKLRRRLRQAQKMEAIGTLAGGIAHDFNNILSAIMGYTELAMYDVPEGKQGQDYLGEVLKAGNRAKGLVKQILTFSRQAEQEIKPLRISPLVKETLKFLRASLPTTINIRQNIQTHSAIVMADPTHIHQILMNLCTNAAQAMKEKGGVLEVILEDVNFDWADVAIYHELSPGPYLRLSVSDSGRGMDSAVKDRIFDPYFTTKEKGEGTGLGLSVTHGIVKSYGGAITVYSEPGKGTTFHVYLPRIEISAGPESITTEPMPKGKERILFVDDEVALVRLGKEALERLGYEVVARTSCIEAFEAFRTQPGRFDLIITDKTMPQMTGFDFARELRRIRPDIPVILCTGFSDTRDPEMARAMGINELVMKPIVQREIAEAIRKVLEQEKEASSFPVVFNSA